MVVSVHVIVTYESGDQEFLLLDHVSRSITLIQWLTIVFRQLSSGFVHRPRDVIKFSCCQTNCATEEELLEIFRVREGKFYFNECDNDDEDTRLLARLKRQILAVLEREPEG